MAMLSIDTIVVVPQGAEHQAVCRGLQQANADIQAIAIPIGTKNVRQILASYTQQLSQAQNVLIMGLCGSLTPSYTVGNSVVIQSCWDLNHNCLNLESELMTIIQNKLSIDAVAGLTSDRLIALATEKRQLSQKYPVSIVDMEGYGYISELQQRGVTVAMLRVVSDDLRRDIPCLSNAIDSAGNLKTVLTAIAFLKQPIAAVRLIQGSVTGLKALELTTAQLFTS
ncbi:MAG: phosphorylase [Pleurocapsa sp.]